MRTAARALLSVTDKSHLEDVAALLASYDYELLASGGTARYLRDHGFPVTDVSEVTGFPEVFGGRVKTLHPLIHGGILGAGRRTSSPTRPMALGLLPIDVVVVNLYPFEETLAAGGTDDELIEKVDIGGPAMLRAAAKNYHRVTVLTSPDQYEEFLHECRAGDGGTPSEAFRRRCALAGLPPHGRLQRSAIADWLAGEAPPTDRRRVEPLRYGENPHQTATLHGARRSRAAISRRWAWSSWAARTSATTTWSTSSPR